MHTGAPYNEEGHVIRDQFDAVKSTIQPDEQAYYLVAEGSYKRWIHRWSGSDFKWINGDYDGNWNPTIPGSPECMYSTGSADVDTLGPTDNHRIQFLSLFVKEGTSSLKMQWDGFPGLTTERLVEVLEAPGITLPSTPSYYMYGGFAAHDLAIPHEWKALGDDENQFAPWIKRMGCTITVQEGLYTRNWFPWVALVRTSITDAWSDQHWEVVAAAIFEPFSGNLGNLSMRLDTSRVDAAFRSIYSAAQSELGIPQVFGFPAACPVVNSHPVDVGTGGSRDETLITYQYMMVAGITPEWTISEPDETDVAIGFEHNVSFHSGWAEYLIPEVLAGF